MKKVKYEVDVGNLYSSPIYFNSLAEAELYYEELKKDINHEYIGIAKITREEIRSEFIKHKEEL